MLRLLINLTIVLGLTACSQVQVTDYQDMQPAFKVEQFFEGQLTAHGVVKNRGGKVIRTFDATIAATTLCLFATNTPAVATGTFTHAAFAELLQDMVAVRDDLSEQVRGHGRRAERRPVARATQH